MRRPRVIDCTRVNSIRRKHALIQHLGGGVVPVRPHHDSAVGSCLREEVDVAERAQQASRQSPLKVDLPFDSVREPQPKHVVANVTHLGNMRKRVGDHRHGRAYARRPGRVKPRPARLVPSYRRAPRRAKPTWGAATVTRPRAVVRIVKWPRASLSAPSGDASRKTFAAANPLERRNHASEDMRDRCLASDWMQCRREAVNAAAGRRKGWRTWRRDRRLVGVSVALPSIPARHTSIISNEERAATEL